MDELLTPLQESAARTGRRYWRMRESNFTAFRVQLDTSRGFPKGEGTRAPTLRALPPVADMPRTNDGSGHVLVNLAAWWIAGDIPITNNPHVAELADAEYEALRPPPEEP